MICDKCKNEVYFLFGRVIAGEHYLLCWDCIVAEKETENAAKK